MSTLVQEIKQLKNASIDAFDSCHQPQRLLLCSPDFFRVIDEKNPHMKGQQGKVDASKAALQWKTMKESFESHGYSVECLQPTKDLEDMVFSANPVFVGEDGSENKICLLANMKHPSRKKEVTAFDEWFSQRDYNVHRLPETLLFEGYGDALWHPGKRLIWAGYGFRTDVAVYQHVSDLFQSPVVTLELQSEYFYHLDTCLSPISEHVALYFPKAFDAKGNDLIRALYRDAIEVPEREALEGFACNSLGLDNVVFIHKGNKHSNRELQKRGFDVVELDTGEFLKSGGSVSCMKAMIF
ncbi:MAG: arginine deiminase-related protein [Bdellovibrionota bacterium]